jgi:hypothetical protein
VKRRGREAWATVALMRERDERFDGCLNCIDQTISGKMVVFRDEFPNSVEVNFSFRVKIMTSH